ncbi:hypothetical protein [Streptomyces halobius]|uniref:Uncharacterized protein n=1 Tax=Streptomyces halobius TaxID=2879846 RepID=A0ABY4M6M5_9ACTN|nr:hypothetical protein [Streptomyces halobius]UQA93424.1 hypothetical protein K9S39_17610 [Streptomyces halobius]
MVLYVRPKFSGVPRTLLRTGLTVTAAGAALAAGSAATANAALVPTKASDVRETARALTDVVSATAAPSTGTFKNMQLDPLANTPADPLNNGVGTRIGDFKPMSTTQVTGTLAKGGTVQDLPVVGPAARALPG